MPALWRAWAWIELVLASAWLLVMLEQASNAGPSMIGLGVVVLGGLALAGSWMIRTITLAWVKGSGRVRDRWTLAAHLAVPVIGLVGASLVFTRADTRLRVRLSEPALVALADDVRAGNAPSTPRWAGLYRVLDATPGGGGTVRLTTRRGWVFSEDGFYHAPSGAPTPGDPRESVEPLAPGWYVFHWDD